MKILNKSIICSYDNYYITPQMEAIDERRKELGKDTIFPLKKLETAKYIPLFSSQLTRKETRKLMKVTCKKYKLISNFRLSG